MDTPRDRSSLYSWAQGTTIARVGWIMVRSGRAQRSDNQILLFSYDQMFLETFSR